MVASVLPDQVAAHVFITPRMLQAAFEFGELGDLRAGLPSRGHLKKSLSTSISHCEGPSSNGVEACALLGVPAAACALSPA